MMKKLLLFIVALLTNITVYGINDSRSIEGIVRDDKGKPLPGISVSVNGTGIVEATNDNGYYAIYLPEGKTQLNFKSVCYEDRTITVGKNDELDVTLNPSAKKMEDITKGNVIMQDDTLTFKVSAFSGSNNDRLVNVLKKLPGVTVDDEKNVTSQGIQVIVFKLDNKPVLNKDVQNLIEKSGTDNIQSIEIIDDYGDSANNTFRYPEPPKIINFVTKTAAANGFGR